MDRRDAVGVIPPLVALLAALASAPCPDVPRGCFAAPPACVVSVCACPVVCGRRMVPLWRRGREGCECG